MKLIFYAYKQRILLVVIVSLLTGLFFSLFTISNNEESSFMLSFFRLFHYANDIKSILPMLLTATPYLILLCCITGIFTDDLAIQSTYCFTRKKSIFDWYISKIGLLFVFSALCVSTFFVSGSIVIFIFMNNNILDLQTFVAVGKMLLIVYLYMFSFAFFMNVISLAIQKKYIFPVAALVTLTFSALIPYSVSVNSRMLLIINPMVHNNAELHSDILPVSFLESMSDTDWSFLGISFLSSCIYFIIVGLFAFVLGLLIIKHSDIAFNEEE